MKVRRIDKNGDWTFGSGLANYARDSEAVEQCVQTVCKSFKYNWHLDHDHGINWWAYFVKNPNVKVMDADIKRNILNVIGVKSLQDLQLPLDTETRQLKVLATYTDIYGIQRTVANNVRDN